MKTFVTVSAVLLQTWRAVQNESSAMSTRAVSHRSTFSVG